MVASLFVYRLSVLPTMSNKILKELQQEIDKYLWNGSRPKIKQEMLSLKSESGGANLIDFVIKSKSIENNLDSDSGSRTKAQKLSLQ